MENDWTFPVEQTISFFDRLGVYAKDRNGISLSKLRSGISGTGRASNGADAAKSGYPYRREGIRD